MDESEVLTISYCAKKSLVLFLAPLFLLSVSCQSDQDRPTSDQAYFRALPPATTGIDFANRIEENERTNFLTYPYLYNGGGVAIGDLDNDGLQDIYFTGNRSGDRLYHNQGTLKFKDITRPAGILSQNLWTTGVTMADVNNDGWLDIYVCRSGDRGFRNNLLYINQGDMTFREAARQWGLHDNGHSTQATFFDFDLDGDLDLYLVNHSTRFNFNQEEIFKQKLNPAPEEADQLYRNDGKHFSNVSQEAGVRHFAFGLSATVSDLNQDGYPDIYAGSDFFEPDFLYLNQGDGTFKDVLKEATGHISFSSMGADIADYNNDGRPDIMVADMRAADHERFHSNMVGMNRHKFARMLTEGYHYQYMQNTLQLHQGIDKNGTPLFSEIGQLAGVSSTDWSWSTLFFDLDNDGWQDLFVSNGIARDIQNKDAWTTINEQRPKKLSFLEMQAYFPRAPLQNYTYKNQRDLSFDDISTASGITYRGATNGAAYADLDNDGDLDLVLNNLNDTASLYENRTAQNKTTHFLQIRLRGREDNHFGLGAKVRVYNNGDQQYRELTLSRGFQSSVPPLLHFGTDSITVVDSMKVTWPNGKTQLLTNISTGQVLTLDQSDARWIENSSTKTETPPFLVAQSLTGPVHREEDYDDFAREPLLPFKQSTHGPCIAVGDVNGDQRDDFYFGGSKGYPGAIYLQTAAGDFIKKEQALWEQDRQHEDTDAIFFDADQDNDLDLYVTSGSTEFATGSPYLQDRLYINDGKASFSSGLLPSGLQNSRCVAASDFDRDGDTDLFVGGAAEAGAYPLAASSYLLINEGGSFTQQPLGQPGMIENAAWADIDQDGDEDLIIVGHWLAPQILENQEGRLQSPGSIRSDKQPEELSGLWNCMLIYDLDLDGKLDIILGNEGLNTRFSVTGAAPLEMFAADYDNNGSLDALMAYHQQGKKYPLPGRDKILSRIPAWQRKFPDHRSFARMDMHQLLAPEPATNKLHLKVDQLASCVLYNQGAGKFSVQLLPTEAQFSAICAIQASDLNLDGSPDLILAGNHHDWEVETSRNDASHGLVLLSDGKRGFRPLSPEESGFLVSGEVNGIEILTDQVGGQFLLVSRKKDSLQSFRLPQDSRNLRNRSSKGQ